MDEENTINHLAEEKFNNCWSKSFSNFDMTDNSSSSIYICMKRAKRLALSILPDIRGTPLNRPVELELEIKLRFMLSRVSAVLFVVSLTTDIS